MRNAPDPTWHQAREREVVAHVQSLLRDPKFVVDTSVGRRAASTLQQTSNTVDRSTELKRQMAQTRPDRELETRMPVGLTTDVQLAVNRWFVLQKIISTVRVSVVPPTKALLAGRPPEPLSIAEGRHALGQLPPPLKNVPMTVILVSTSGWALEAHELADRTAERVVILVEPNEAGGWSVHGPPEMRGVLDLLDPETADGKRDRVRQAIDNARDELLTGSVAADKLSLTTQLPLGLVEEEVKAYAKSSGLIAKRLDGRMLLFREGTAVTGKSIGGEGMTLMDRIRTLFNRKGDNEKKIAYLSERRAALAQQRDAAHDEVETLEKKELTLKSQFKATDSLTTRKRITAQLVQLRKDMERRQQMLGVLNQQVNVVSTHLHNLELVQQGRGAKLPDTEEIATDAAAAEEMLAELQADSELADSVSASSTTLGMSDEEAALFAELTGELGDTDKASETSGATVKTTPDGTAAPTPREAADRASSTDPRRANKPEAG